MRRVWQPKLTCCHKSGRRLSRRLIVMIESSLAFCAASAHAQAADLRNSWRCSSAAAAAQEACSQPAGRPKHPKRALGHTQKPRMHARFAFNYLLVS